MQSTLGCTVASWREMAEAATVRVPTSATRVVPDDGLPNELREGLHWLALRRPPLIERPDVWPRVVADAEYLARDRWAVKALALGWSGQDLFGVGPSDSDQFESLAVWLNGRKVAALGGMKAMTTCGAMFLREAWGHATSPIVQPVYLWEWKAAGR